MNELPLRHKSRVEASSLAFLPRCLRVEVGREVFRGDGGSVNAVVVFVVVVIVVILMLWLEGGEG